MADGAQGGGIILQQARIGILATTLLLLAGAASALTVIDNGLAPPNPANVFTGGDTDVWVRDQGCAGEPTPCPSPGPATTVSIEAYLLQLTTYDSSIGIITSDLTEIGEAHNGSQIELAGGLSYGLAAYDQASILLSGGLMDSFGSGIQLFGSSSLQVGAGGGPGVSAEESSSVWIHGGYVDGFVSVQDDATALISGGQIGSGGGSLVSSSGNGVVTITGGFFYSNLNATSGGTIRIVGSDFAVGGAPVGLGPLSGSFGLELTGTLADGTSLFIEQFQQSGGGTIVLVPEPSTALLLAGGLAALAVRRRAVQS